ncbi:MAG: hypothetical protein AAGI22_10575 [Planctomycetota bacterium]
MPIDIAQDGNLFPREDLLEAVASSDWRDQRVPAVAWIVASLGVAALAAGMPVAATVLTGPTEFAASSPSAITRPVHALAETLGRAGLGIEAAFFLLAAIGHGLCLPALGLALRAAGFSGRLAFVSALVASAAPLLVVHGRLPSDAPFLALGAILLFVAVMAPADEGPAGRRGRTFRMLLAGFVALTVGAPASTAPLFGRIGDAALAGGVLWFVAPLAWVREAEEEPPPRWLAAWVVLAFAAGLASVVALAALAPLAALFANVLARRARPDGALRLALGALGLQVACAAAAIALLPPSTTSFATTSAGATKPGDVVFVDDDTSTDAFLLRRRLGLRVIADEGPSAPTEPAARPSGRLLSLDRPRPGVPWVLDAVTGEVVRGE